jgi:N-acetylglucosamine kinase-like BadF-type ATPase
VSARGPLLLAVDGGNSKTDLALLDADGRVLSLRRGPASSPHHLGLDRSLDVIERLLHEALGDVGSKDGRPGVALAHLFLAGVDFPVEEREAEAAAGARNWAERVAVSNDTFAVLRAGTERGWGVAVTCGAGINCVGVAPDGRTARFPALGEVTGDWGGGRDIGFAALAAAARSEDGRGPKTSLEHVVPRHFELETPLELAEALHRGRIATERVVELAPVVFSEAESDVVAAGIIDRLATEIVALARAALDRLDLAGAPIEVLLGGGVLRAGDGRLIGAIEAGLREVGPAIAVRRTESAPIVGAALRALDEVGAMPDAQARLRRELDAAAAKLGPTDG